MEMLIMLVVMGGIFYLFIVRPAKKKKELNEIQFGMNSKIIDYFCKQESCLSKNMTDDEYMRLVIEKRDSLDLRQKAINKIGLDEDEIREIPPAMFEGFVFSNAYAKRRADGKWVSSSYQVSWVFFSSTQVYLYSYTFKMDEDVKIETTDEFFYKDVTSFSTSSETETAKGLQGKTFTVESNKFAMIVPGTSLYKSMDGVPDADSIIQAMKQKLREKKQ